MNFFHAKFGTKIETVFPVNDRIHGVIGNVTLLHKEPLRYLHLWSLYIQYKTLIFLLLYRSVCSIKSPTVRGSYCRGRSWSLVRFGRYGARQRTAWRLFLSSSSSSFLWLQVKNTRIISYRLLEIVEQAVGYRVATTAWFNSRIVSIWTIFV